MEVCGFDMNENAVVASLKITHVFQVDFFAFPVSISLLWIMVGQLPYCESDFHSGTVKPVWLCSLHV